jgi:hypothetical protein
MPMTNLNLTWGSNTPASQRKLQELVLYVAQKTAQIDDFGTTKINKTLYHADMAMFRETGRAITGVQYHRIQNGPVPKHILVAERALVEAGALEIDQSVAAHKRIAKRQPDLSLFDNNELSQVDAQIEAIRGDTSAKVSLDSHDVRWHAVNHQGIIPYEFAFLEGKATEKDKVDAAVFAVELGW